MRHYSEDPVLKVATPAQKFMFNNEFCGQISDGMWENTQPYDHWEVWCDAHVEVDPDNIGRNFYAKKDNYALNSKQLLDVVGDRVLFGLNLLAQLPILADMESGRLPESAYDYRHAVANREGFWGRYVAMWELAGITPEVIEKASNNEFVTKKQMMEEIRGLRQAMKTYRR